MPETRETLENIKNEVNKATQLLLRKHRGANLEEAKQLLLATAKAVNENRYEDAVDFAKKAQLAADPTTEYLLSRAKSVESQGTEAYQNQLFGEAIEFWQQSLKEYDNVCQHAKMRGEQEVTEQVTNVMSTIEADIQAAKVENNNRELFELIAQANKETSEAKALYNSGKFDDAVNRFSRAREKYSQTVKIARENKLEDESRLQEAVAGMQSSIESCYLGKSRELLKAAVNKKGSEKEQNCTEVINYLNSFSSTSPLYIELQQQAFGGIAEAKIDVGMSMMKEAEELYKKPDIYQAKESYRRAQEYFNKVSDFTVEHHLDDKRREVDRLIDACIVNIRDAAAALSSRTSIVKPAPPKRVADIERGVQFETTVGLDAYDKVRMTQLEETLKGDYTEIRWLNPGGVNYIAVALDKSGNKVALRLPKQLDRGRQRTFLDESRAWENLHQRNIVQLIQTVVSPPLLELEYVEGGSLKEFLARNPVVDKKRACYIINDIARGLQYAHSKDVVHGDLKPSNILLTKTLEAKITDWSVGKSYTPGYAAPEQIDGRPADFRTDIYQLAVIFYEIACGENPFGQGSILEIQKRTLNSSPEKLSKSCPDLKSMDEIVLRCLAKNPDSRPSIKEFRNAIYIYMKQYHGESLHSIQAGSAQTNDYLELALIAAKQNATDDLIEALENAVKEKRVQAFSQQMKYIKVDINIKDSVLYKSNISIPEGAEKNIEIQDGMVDDISKLIAAVGNG
jgi:serine/threonine protein kinase